MLCLPKMSTERNVRRNVQRRMRRLSVDGRIRPSMLFCRQRRCGRRHSQEPHRQDRQLQQDRDLQRARALSHQSVQLRQLLVLQEER